MAKVTTREPRCGSSGGLLIWRLDLCRYGVWTCLDMEAKSTIYITVAPGPTPEDHLILDTVEQHIEEQAVTEVTHLARFL